MSNTTWHTIPDWNGWYQITVTGEVRLHPEVKDNPYKQRINPGDSISSYVGQGYLRVNLRHPKDPLGYISQPVHRLLMLTFKPISDLYGMQVNHKDGNKLNNELTNLEWCSQRENLAHAWKNGLRRHPRHDILTADQVGEIRAVYVKGQHPSMRELSVQYGITPSAMWRILNNKTWRHLL